MSVGMVTARSHGGLRPANIGRAPTSSRVVRLRSVRNVRTRIPAAIQRGVQTKAQKVAVRKMAALLVQSVLRAPSLFPIATTVGWLVFNEVRPPAAFPGFEQITPGWRAPPIGDTYSPGDYVPNPFDHGAFDNPPESLLDTDDVIFPTGIRYWGDFLTNPYPFPLPAINWPIIPRPWFKPDPKPQYRPRYNPRPDLSPQVRARLRPRWRPRSNMRISFRINPRPGQRKGTGVEVKFDVPRKRTLDDKAKPANQFVYAVLKQLANTMGETKEWIDILAEAAGYRSGSKTIPEPIRRGRETVAKAYYLFVNGGIVNIDFETLGVLVIENEIEDFLIGIAGRMSKSAARSLGLTVGPQTGLVL